MSATLNSTLLNDAMRKAGWILDSGRGPSPEQTAEAIREENRMIGGWNLSSLLILQERIDLRDTIANQQSYSIGIDPTGSLTADWDDERPNKIYAANLLMPTDADPIKRIRRPIFVRTKTQWASIAYQGVFTYPAELYYLFNDTKQAAPFGRVYFRPIPDAVYQIEIFSWQRVPNFTSASANVMLPDGYEDAIVNNLAVRLNSNAGTRVPLHPQVALDARSALERIKQFNASSPEMSTNDDFGGGGGVWNFRTGLMDL